MTLRNLREDSAYGVQMSSYNRGRNIGKRMKGLNITMTQRTGKNGRLER